MNALVLEVGGSHFEIIYTFIKMLRSKPDLIQSVHLVCNKSLIDLLPTSQKVDGYLLVDDHIKGIRKKLKICSEIKKYILEHKIDFLVIGSTEVTLVRDLTFFLPPMKVIMGVVHDSAKLENNFKFSHVLSRRIKKYIVLNDDLLSNLKANPKFKVHSVNPVYFPPIDKLVIQKPSHEKWITIPGTVLPDRRDYKGFIDKLLEKEGMPENVKIILLGYLNKENKNDLTDLIESASKKINFITFDTYLDYDTFHSYIQQSDFLAPIFLDDADDQFLNHKKISGNINLGIGYHVPFLLHTSFENTTVKNFSIYYSSYDEMIDIILRDNTEVINRIKSSYQEDKRFDIDSQAEKFFQFALDK